MAECCASARIKRHECGAVEQVFRIPKKKVPSHERFFTPDSAVITSQEIEGFMDADFLNHGGYKNR